MFIPIGSTETIQKSDKCISVCYCWDRSRVWQFRHCLR